MTDRCKECGCDMKPEYKCEDICDDCYQGYCNMIEEGLAREARESEGRARWKEEMRKATYGDPYD